MPTICPTILADNPHTYREQLERIESFAKRIHLDFTDGKFAPTHTISPVQAYWSDDTFIDMHVMFGRPAGHIEKLIDMKPSLIILHAEAEGELLDMFNEISAAGIKTGVALLKDTSARDAELLLRNVDYVMIFSGDLGKFGGKTDYSLFNKIKDVKEINPNLEIGWDGGINDENAADLVRAGVDVLNVGGFIQKADNPQSAYDILNGIIHQ